MQNKEILKNRLNDIRQEVDMAAAKNNRSGQDISIICVAKQARLEDIVTVIESGFFQIGENRLQEAEKKYAYLQRVLKKEVFSQLNWHLVGHLQTNKVARALNFIDMIQSVDSLRLANIIDRQAQRLQKDIDVLIQVNISGEQSKFGITFAEVQEFIERVINLPRLRIKGLMGIGPFVDDPEQTRPCFRRLRKMFEEVNRFLRAKSLSQMSVLSMGMSNDYLVAIEEGANMVRIGRAIFGG